MNVGQWLSANTNGAWAGLTSQERMAIRDFPVPWALFELKISHPQTADAAAIIRATDRLPVRSAIDQKVFSDAFAHYRNRYYRGDRKTRYYAPLGLSGAGERRVVEVFDGTLRGARNELTAVLLVINRLRNNYLHGSKAVDGFRNQLHNFRHANRTLMAAIPLW